jgi:exopolysaccharide biosynthesis polyprenyl glycosylphosphotransferase
VLGVPVDVLTTPELIARVEQLADDAARTHLVCYVNAACLNQAVFDRRYRAILHQADLVYADGMGVVWASNLTDCPLPERITLGDMLPELCRLAVSRGLRLFFLGGRPGVAAQAAQRLVERFPGLAVVGTQHGYFSSRDDERIIEQINQARPHILLVGMGVPKQEKWLWQHRKALRVPLLWGVGAVFEYYAGATPRAPVWLRRLGCEWAFRLAVEPGRLWRRYVFGHAFFILRAAALPLVDAALVAAAWLGAYAVRQRLTDAVGLAINPVDPYLRITPLIVGIWLAAAAAFGSYRRALGMAFGAELAQVARATGAGLLSTMAAAFLFKELDLGRSVILPFGVSMCLLLTGSRVTIRWLERVLASQGIGLRRTLIIGTGPLAKRLRDEIELSPDGYEVVGFVDEAKDAPCAVPRDEVLGAISEMGRLIDEYRVEDLFVSGERLTLDDTLNLLAQERQRPVTFHIIAEELEPFARRVRLGRAAGLPILELPTIKPNGWYEGTKRAFDLAVAATGLLVTAPLLGLIALAIRCESSGPALFAQLRVGRGGRLLRMVKFRTMQVGTPAYAISPNDLWDPRVTRCGRWLRRWSLDELPQLVNVLRGEMSIVGPRPEMPFIVEQYQPWERHRLLVKPGLTGLWQVVGRKELPLDRHLEYDLYYVRNRGWPLDAAILVRTVPAVLFRRGAF